MNQSPNSQHLIPNTTTNPPPKRLRLSLVSARLVRSVYEAEARTS